MSQDSPPLAVQKPSLLWSQYSAREQKLVILDVYIEYEWAQVWTCGALCSGRGSAINPIRRCGQFFVAGKQKVLLDE